VGDLNMDLNSESRFTFESTAVDVHEDRVAAVCVGAQEEGGVAERVWRVRMRTVVAADVLGSSGDSRLCVPSASCCGRRSSRLTYAYYGAVLMAPSCGVY
jgi:hypothetical protein